MNLMSSHIAESRGTNETMYDQLREEILKFLGGDVNMTAEIMALPQEQRVTNIYHYQSQLLFELSSYCRFMTTLTCLK